MQEELLKRLQQIVNESLVAHKRTHIEAENILNKLLKDGTTDRPGREQADKANS